MPNICDIDCAKSYKTAENLHAALLRLGFECDRYIIVRNSQGRFTAIFILDRSEGGYIARWSSAGFISV